jgi:hypothetical protein
MPTLEYPWIYLKESHPVWLVSEVQHAAERLLRTRSRDRRLDRGHIRGKTYLLVYDPSEETGVLDTDPSVFYQRRQITWEPC